MKKSIFILLTFFIAGNMLAQKGDFASLAIDSRNGNQYGWAINYNLQHGADARALKECESKGGNKCQIVLRFKGGCGAYVVERGNSSLDGWGTADSRQEAEKIAKNETRAQGGKNLVVRAWGCNDKPLEDSEEVALNLNGVYLFHLYFNKEEKRCFITNPIYQPQVAEKKNDKWIWTNDAEQLLYPKAKKFLDIVTEKLYGYLGDLKDKAITQNPNWQGLNEIANKNYALDYPHSERKESMESAIQKVIQHYKNEGFKIEIIDME